MPLEPIQNKSLSSVSTFGIGGLPAYYLEVKTIEEMKEAFLFSKAKNLPFLILGKGSNCLFDDKGFVGVVIQNKIDFHEKNDAGLFHVGAGYSFSLLGAQTARAGFSGLEFASGIPGSVGGAVFMNAGANGRETCEALLSVDFMSPDGSLKTLKKEDLHFAYRTSSFQKMEGAITGATFALSPLEGARGKQLEIINYRKKTQPYGEKSAGCVFRNPNGGHAGALIDASGLKGVSCGGAEVSSVHANFIVNSGGATSEDVINLIHTIKQQVKEKKGVELESEIRYIPYNNLR